MKTPGRLGIAALAAAVLLAGVTACAAEAPAPPTSSEPTITATATPQQTAPAQVVVTAEGLSLLDDTGATVGNIVYAGDALDAVAQLTAFFGEPATEVPYPGAIEETPGIDHTWGGFAYRVSDHAAGSEWYNQSVRVTSGEIGEITVRTGSGLRIGSPRTDVEAQAAEPGQSFDGETFYTGLEPYDRPDSTHPLFPGDLIDSILVVVAGDTDVVTLLLAPSRNYGI